VRNRITPNMCFALTLGMGPYTYEPIVAAERDSERKSDIACELRQMLAR
jgi:hypothetical protein